MSNTDSSQHKQALHTANRRLVRRLVIVTVLMFGFGFALWPLYNVFCAITGIGGRTGVVDNAQAQAQQQAQALQAPRWVTVTFDANTDSNLPWRFQPAQKSMRVQTGVLTETHYLATNLAQTAIVGRAIPSVAPAEASLYFNKTECFCFSEQTLAAQQSRDMPVRFIIDPKLPQGIDILTLSYTFFRQDASSDIPVATNTVANQHVATLQPGT